MARGNTMILAGGASINNATFTGQSLFADGTAAAPSIAFTNSPTTGLYRIGADQLAISSQGTGFVMVDSSATTPLRVVTGIGLASAIASATDIRLIRGGSGVLYMGNASATNDNEASIGDATHRLATVQTKSITIGQSMANPNMGIVTLSGGTGTASVQTTALTANSRIFLTHQNATGTTGTARVTASTVGVNFTIVSSNAADTSTIAWFIFNAS